MGAFTERQKRLPRNALWVGDPRLIGLRVAAGGLAFFEGWSVCPLETVIDLAKLGAILGLNAEMMDANGASPSRYGEVDARVVEHPLGVVGLSYVRLGGEQCRVKPDRRVEIGNANMNMKALQAVLPS